MTEELKVTPEAVRKAAEECPDAERVLRTMFPEAFEQDAVSFHDFNYDKITKGSLFNPIASIASAGKFKDRAIWLSELYQWEIQKDGPRLYAVPTRK